LNGLFVTGTDTDCGKTEISLGLMSALQARGLRVLGMKPVATGCTRTAAGMRNDDALRLLGQGTTPAPYELVNPYAFAPPIAPHIAAGQAGSEIELATIVGAYQTLSERADWMIVEGVGGWRVPLGPTTFVGDIPGALGLSVLLVVGVRLGCINHALLSVESIRAGGNRLSGWVANQIEPSMLARDENLATLAALIGAPCIGVVPWLDPPGPDAVARYLHPELLCPPSPKDGGRARGRGRER
jgi:dethiobiotin synthetase